MISQIFDSGQTDQYTDSSLAPTLDNWADTHGLDLASIIDFALHHPAAKAAADFDPQSKKTTLTSDDVKKLTLAAIHSNLPQISDETETSFEIVELKTHIRASRLAPPYFQPREDDVPIICLDFDGSARSVIDLVHEYGHAAHYYACGRANIPPIFREVFAFLTEFFFLEHLRSLEHSDLQLLEQTVVFDDEGYLGDDLSLLAEAVRNRQSSYKYRWNYPIARYLAGWLFRYYDRDRIYSLFQHEGCLTDLLNIDEILHDARSWNTLPELPDLPKDSAQSAYAHLGAMTMLDMEYMVGPSELPIADYYELLSAHLRNQSTFLMLDGHSKPTAYAAWRTDLDGTVTLTRQSAPFGDHLSLLKTLRSHFGDKRITSEHLRASRREQQPW